MALFRLVFMLLGLAFLLSMAAYTLTGQPIWRQRGMQVLKWAVVAGLCLFGVLILRRAAVLL